MNHREFLLICARHPNYPVPVIYTYAFPGAEYWCPCCGDLQSVMGDMIELPMSNDLKPVIERWVKDGTINEYLQAKTTLECDGLMWEGKVISPSELPEQVKQKLQSIVDNWKYER